MLVAETVVYEVGNDMNIIVHVGCPDTRHSCMLAAHAEKIGAAATSAVPCVYYRPSEESVYQHWTKITEAADGGTEVMLGDPFKFDTENIAEWKEVY